MGGKPKKDKSNSASTTSSGYGGGGSDSTKAGAGNGAAGTKDERLEQLQADHELFLQAFESKWHG